MPKKTVEVEASEVVEAVKDDVVTLHVKEEKEAIAPSTENREEKIATQSLATVQQIKGLPEWSKKQKELIKSQIAKGCTDDELALFGQVCQRTGLDPFSRQIYAISRNQYNPETNQKEPKMTIQVSIDGFRTIAARSGLYGGSVTEWCGADGVWKDIWLDPQPPAGAKTTVYRVGSNSPFVGSCSFKSYAQKYFGKLSGLWERMPDTMIGKVSEALALRKAFPAELSGLYTTEEMAQADNTYSKDEPKDVTPKQNAKGVTWQTCDLKQGVDATLAWGASMTGKSLEEITTFFNEMPPDANGKKGAKFVETVEIMWSTAQ